MRWLCHETYITKACTYITAHSLWVQLAHLVGTTFLSGLRFLWRSKMREFSNKLIEFRVYSNRRPPYLKKYGPRLLRTTQWPWDYVEDVHNTVQDFNMNNSDVLAVNKLVQMKMHLVTKHKFFHRNSNQSFALSVSVFCFTWFGLWALFAEQ